MRLLYKRIRHGDTRVTEHLNGGQMSGFGVYDTQLAGGPFGEHNSLGPRRARTGEAHRSLCRAERAGRLILLGRCLRQIPRSSAEFGLQVYQISTGHAHVIAADQTECVATCIRVIIFLGDLCISAGNGVGHAIHRLVVGDRAKRKHSSATGIGIRGRSL